MSDNPTAELIDLMRNDAGEILSAIEGALGNQRTGMGTANSVFWGTSVGMAPLLREQELRALYRSNWLIRRIVDVPAEDMTKNSVEVVLSDDGDEEDATKAMALYQDSNPVDSPFESEYTLDQARYDAIRWARLFGRAYIVVHVNGGEDPSKPLRRVKSFDGVTVLDRFQLSPAPGEYNRYNPEFYALGTFQEDIDSSRARKVPFGWGQRIHRSRVLPFDGNRIHPADVQLDGDAGHDSVIQNLYDIFVRHFTAREGLSEGLASYSLFVATINGLSNLLSTPNGETALRRYLQTLNQQKSVYRTVVRDGEAGSADFVERTFAGVGEVMGQIVNELTAATGLPHYKVWGHEANTNALSQGGTESRAYASQVNSWQKRDLAPNDRRLFKMLFQVATGDIPSFKLEYPTIYEPTPQELAELEGQKAATFRTYIESGVILPAHAKLALATGQDIETILDAEDIRRELKRHEKELRQNEGIMQAESIRKAIADRLEVYGRAGGLTPAQIHHAIATGEDLQDFLKPLDPERLEFPAEEDPEGEGADPNVALEALFGGGDAGTVEEAPVDGEPAIQMDSAEWREDKTCIKGRSCGASCIAKAKKCRMGIGGTKKKAADKVAGGDIAGGESASNFQSLSSQSGHDALPFFGNAEKNADGSPREKDITRKEAQQIMGQQAKWMQDNLGLSEAKSKSAVRGIAAWTNESSYDMRAKDMAGNPDKKTRDMLEALDKMPAFEGTIFRGAQFESKDQLNNFIDEFSSGGSTKALGAFTSSKDVAKGYAMGDRNKPIKAIVMVKGNKSGKTINNFASWIDTQDEVIVPKGVNYRTLGIRTAPLGTGEINIITVEEV
jgi:phage-related protein (TIGR01555 family)